MTATTEIKQFAGDSGANVITQAEYAALTAVLADGFPAGQILPSAQLNKVLRQSAFMAAGVAGVAVDAGVSVPDDGNLSALITNLKTVFRATSGSNSNGKWMKIPGAWTFQCGSVQVNPGGPVTVTFPVEFSSACFGVLLTKNSQAAGEIPFFVLSSLSTTSFQADNDPDTNGWSGFWFAVGA